jgi:hypothetical protein
VYGDKFVFYAVYVQGPEMLQIIVQLVFAGQASCFGSFDALVNTYPYYEGPEDKSQQAGRLSLCFLDRLPV